MSISLFTGTKCLIILTTVRVKVLTARPSGEMLATTDLKSVARSGVRVGLPPRLPTLIELLRGII
jgi:hypothetical protein